MGSFNICLPVLIYMQLCSCFVDKNFVYPHPPFFVLKHHKCCFHKATQSEKKKKKKKKKKNPM